MKKYLLWICFMLLSIPSFGQGSGLGYNFEIGWSNYSQPTSAYGQSIRTFTHNGFLRFHNARGNNAIQLNVGYRIDTIYFQNFSQFMGPDGVTLLEYNTNALLSRNAWKFGIVNQFQFGGKPGKVIFSLNAGLFYERSIRARRSSYYDEKRYELDEEINKNNLGIILGGEMRFGWFTFGFKYEKLFMHVLNHDYILGQGLSLENSSELRGLKLNPGMAYIYLGVNLDFFED